MNPEGNKSSRESRANRLKIIRKMTGLSQRAFAERYGFPFTNFQNWEGPRYGGLTENAAQMVIEGCHTEGIEVSIEWLMFGIEPGPEVTEKAYLKDSNFIVTKLSAWDQSAGYNSEISLIAKELLLFKQHYQEQVLEMMVNDDGMDPCYQLGDYVAGKSFEGEDIQSFLGTDCVIKLFGGDLRLRSLRAGSNDNLFNLVCTNPQTKVPKPVIYDVEVVSVAPVMWVRRKLPIANYV